MQTDRIAFDSSSVADECLGRRPCVSVLMSVYNGEPYLEEAVESILNQTFEDFEFIIIDDCSTDGTWSLLNRYTDPRIRFMRNQENIGLTKSLNKGLEVARGEFIARQDADDISLPVRLERQVRFLEADGSLVLVGAWVRCINHKGKKIGEFRSPSNCQELQRGLFINNQFCHGSVMFRRTDVERVGLYRPGLPFAQDYDLWLRLAERYRVSNVPEYLYKLRISDGMVSLLFGEQQRLCAALARRLAEERRVYGRELTRLSDAIRTIELIGTDAQSRSAMAKNYFCWGSLLLRMGVNGWHDAVMMLWRAFRLAPLDVHLWHELARMAWWHFRRLLGHRAA